MNPLAEQINNLKKERKNLKKEICKLVNDKLILQTDSQSQIENLQKELEDKNTIINQLKNDITKKVEDEEYTQELEDKLENTLRLIRNFCSDCVLYNKPDCYQCSLRSLLEKNQLEETEKIF